TEDDVRSAAARALGKFRGSEAAVQALAVALDDPNPAIQHRVTLSMGAVSGRSYGADVVAWREFAQVSLSAQNQPPKGASKPATF
ncbi:MAG: HEAT repeat domain-containing protein, partial [Pirellulaceae bacterium]|nr:HEAT repeat domain-containing protein [Pirellulaceae bacterium]